MAAGPLALASLEPVFIWAPSARCGVTLLQRLITSSREVLVFGEDTFLTNMLPQAIMTYANRPASDEARKRLAGGDYKFWSSAAHPDTQAYKQAALQSLMQVIGVYESSARAEGFSRWGVKEPNPNWDAVNIFATLMPKSRHVFIYRHLVDVLRSYKARGWLTKPGSARDTAKMWSVNVENILNNAGSSRCCVVRYETLLENREQETAQLCAYLGIKNVDLSVFDTKVNTFAAETDVAKGQYVAPVELTAQERSDMFSEAGPMLARAGYQA